MDRRLEQTARLHYVVQTIVSTHRIGAIGASVEHLVADVTQIIHRENQKQRPHQNMILALKFTREMEEGAVFSLMFWA